MTARLLTRSRKPPARANTTATATASKDLANITEASNVVTYTAGPGINNNVSVTISGDGSNFVFNDTAEALYTTIAGESGSGTNTVDIPTTGVTGIILSLGNGADAISSTGVVLGAQNLTISNTGTGVTVNGPISTSGATTINAGTTLQVINGGSLGTGQITDSGGLKFNLTSALAVSNVISGTGEPHPGWLRQPRLCRGRVPSRASRRSPPGH